jgi:hypothetical protein
MIVQAVERPSTDSLVTTPGNLESFQLGNQPFAYSELPKDVKNCVERIVDAVRCRFLKERKTIDLVGRAEIESCNMPSAKARAKGREIVKDEVHRAKQKLSSDLILLRLGIRNQSQGESATSGIVRLTLDTPTTYQNLLEMRFSPEPVTLPNGIRESVSLSDQCLLDYFLNFYGVELHRKLVLLLASCKVLELEGKQRGISAPTCSVVSVAKQLVDQLIEDTDKSVETLVAEGIKTELITAFFESYYQMSTLNLPKKQERPIRLVTDLVPGKGSPAEVRPNPVKEFIRQTLAGRPEYNKQSGHRQRELVKRIYNDIGDGNRGKSVEELLSAAKTLVNDRPKLQRYFSKPALPKLEPSS